MGDDEKVKKLPIKPRKNTWISESGKGIVVRPLTEEEKEEKRKKETIQASKSIKPSEAEILPPQKERLSDDIDKVVDDWDLDRVEKELVRIDKEEGFLARLLHGDSDQYEIEKLKKSLEKLKLSQEIREVIISREIQSDKAKEMLLEAKASLVKKKVLTHPEVQKLNVEIEILNRLIEKTQKELEKTQLEKRLEALKKGKELAVEEYHYDLGEFEHLKKEESEE